jgi:hypothetical protein
MRKILRLDVLYRCGSNPHDTDAEWREITIKSDNWPSLASSYAIEEFSGFEKKQTDPHTVTLFSEKDFNEVLRKYEEILQRLEKDGFCVYDPRTWQPS